jgi:hypothetical protein
MNKTVARVLFVKAIEHFMKKLFFIFLLLSCVGFSFLYYYWQQATHLPDWYTTRSKSTERILNFSNPSELTAAKARLQEKIEASITKSQAISSPSRLPLTVGTSSPTTSTEEETSREKNVEIELSNREVNELVMTTIAEQTRHSKVLANIPSFHTTIKDGSLESGTVINLANLPENQIPESERAALEKVLKAFPALENKNVYVGISGKPQIEKGQLKWDDNTKVKLGKLSFSLSELSQRLGISQEQLEQNLNLSLQLGRLKVNDLEVTDDKVLLQGSVD